MDVKERNERVEHALARMEGRFGARFSRTAFLRSAGYAALVAGIVGGAPMLPWGTKEARARAATVTVINPPYSADRTGGSDSTAAIQAAIDDQRDAGGGAIFVPAGVYNITRKLYMGNGVELYGAYDSAGSRASHIRNTRPSGGRSEMSVISLGSYNSVQDSFSFQDEAFFAFEPAARNVQSIRTTPDFAGRFFVGDPIIMRSSEAWVPGEPGGRHTSWRRMELNVVASVNRSTGVIGLKYPITEEFETLRVARSSGALKDDMGGKVQVVQDAVVRDLVLSQVNVAAANTAIFQFGGMIGCNVLRIDVPQADAFFVNNGVSRTTVDVRGCNVKVARKAFDIAYYSHEAKVYAGDLYRMQNTQDESMMIAHGDGAHNCLIEAKSVQLGRTNPDISTDGSIGDKARCAVNIGYARRPTMTVGYARAQDVPEALVLTEFVFGGDLQFGNLDREANQDYGVYLHGSNNRLRVNSCGGGLLKDVYVADDSRNNACTLGGGVAYTDASGNTTNTMTRI